MNPLTKIWKQLRRGENIELYLLVILSVILIILDLTDVAKPEWIFSLTLTALALFAISLLGLRGQVEKIHMKMETSAHEVFFKKYPDYVQEKLFAGKEVLIVGIFLSTTVSENYNNFGEMIENGSKLNFLVINPNNGPLMKMAAERLFSGMDAQWCKATILRSLGFMCRLKERMPSCVDIRVLDYMPSFGFYGIDTDTKGGIIFAEHYGYKLRADQPKFVLRPQEDEWYELFKNQIDLYWNGGEEWIHSIQETERMMASSSAL